MLTQEEEATLSHITSSSRGIFQTGSSYICRPPVTSTDIDFVCLEAPRTGEVLEGLGFTAEGKPEFYTGNDNGSFTSYRKGRLNVILTPYHHYFEKFKVATHLAKRFNLTAKPDRLALFQVVLYDVSIGDIETPPCEDLLF